MNTNIGFMAGKSTDWALFTPQTDHNRSERDSIMYFLRHRRCFQQYNQHMLAGQSLTTIERRSHHLGETYNKKLDIVHVQVLYQN